MLPAATASRRARTSARNSSISSVHIWRTSKRRGQSRIRWFGLPQRWHVCGVPVFARWVAMSMGTPGWSAAVGREGGKEEGAGLAGYVGAGARANKYDVRPSDAWWAGADLLVDEAWNASLANRFKSKRRAALYQPSGSSSAGLSVPDSAIRSCVEALRPRRNLITIAKGSE